MSEPIILKRCPSCGASIRDKAFFCPQCGQDIQEGSEAETKPLHETQEIVRDAVTLTEADFQRQKARSSSTPKKNKSTPEDVPREKPKAQVAQRAKEQVGARIQRATTKARNVEGNVAQRVQKFREISSVVIDEAGYDPSLRFILVAVVLFVLFVVIVLLNKLIA